MNLKSGRMKTCPTNGSKSARTFGQTAKRDLRLLAIVPCRCAGCVDRQDHAE